MRKWYQSLQISFFSQKSENEIKFGQRCQGFSVSTSEKQKPVWQQIWQSSRNSTISQSFDGEEVITKRKSPKAVIQKDTFA